jgi:hypothetical protein
MRAGGLLAGLLLLVLGWVAWFATSGPHRGPRPMSKGPAGHRDHAARADLAPRPVPASLPEAGAAVLDPLRATPVLAETREGDSLADVAQALGLPGRLFAIAATEPPALLGLVSGPATVLDLLARPPHPDAAFVGALPVPPEGAWVSLYLGDVLLATRRVTAGQVTLRFVLSAEFLRERVLFGGPIS